MGRALLAAVAALALVACQHRHPLSAEQLGEFRQGGRAILVMDGDMTKYDCHSARYNFVNLDDQSKLSIKSEAGAGAGVVQAGRYKLDFISCAVVGGGWRIPAKNWFSAINVNDGDVAYLGTIVVKRYVPTSSAGGATQNMDFLIQYDQALPIYSIRDEIAAAKKVLRPEIGDLVDRMVFHPPKVLLSEALVSKAIERANEPDANGVAPTLYEALTKMAAEQEALLE